MFNREVCIVIAPTSTSPTIWFIARESVGMEVVSKSRPRNRREVRDGSPEHVVSVYKLRDVMRFPSTTSTLYGKENKIKIK